MKTKEKYANMDLFRILMMLFVIGHHYLKKENISMNDLTIDNSIYFILRHLFIIGVNGFILISGFFLSQKAFRISRIINLLFWLSIYSMGLYTTFSILGYGPEFTWHKFITSFLPGNWWFMFPYVALLLISPFLNKLITSLNYKQNLLLLIIAFLIEVVWSSTFSSSEIDRQNGYSLYNFIFLYLLGAHIRLYNYKIKSNFILLLLIISLFISSILHYLLNFQLRHYDFFSWKNQFYDYNFITVFLCSILCFIWFTKIKFKSKFISKLRPHVLSAYLIHTHPNVDPFLFSKFLPQSNFPQCQHILIRVMIFTIVTFSCSIIIDFILQLSLKDICIKISNKIENVINYNYHKFENFMLSQRDNNC